jgi:hypothetical protein
MVRVLGWMAAILVVADQLFCNGTYTEIAKRMLTHMIAHI